VRRPWLWCTAPISPKQMPSRARSPIARYVASAASLCASASVTEPSARFTEPRIRAASASTSLALGEFGRSRKSRASSLARSSAARASVSRPIARSASPFATSKRARVVGSGAPPPDAFVSSTRSMSATASLAGPEIISSVASASVARAIIGPGCRDAVTRSARRASRGASVSLPQRASSANGSQRATTAAA